MENILNRIIGECRGANKYAAIAQAATEARGKKKGVTDMAALGAGHAAQEMPPWIPLGQYHFVYHPFWPAYPY